MLDGGVWHVSIVPVTFRHGLAAIARDDGGGARVPVQGSSLQFHLRTECWRPGANIRGLQSWASSWMEALDGGAGWRRWISDYDGVPLTLEGRQIAARNLRSAVIHGSKVALGQAGFSPR